jgi:hypothetical protein
LDLQKSAVFLNVKLGKVGKRRKVSSTEVEVDADKSMLHVSKDIFESKELQAIAQLHSALKAYLKSVCLPSPVRRGVYMLRTDLIETTMNKIAEFEAQIEEAVKAFMLFYQPIYEERHSDTAALRQRLGPLYDPSDYPRPSKVRAAFVVETQVLELSTPGNLRAVNMALYERERLKMDNMWERAQQTVTQVLLEEFRKLTAHLAERLTPDPEGKKKAFHATNVSNLQDWLDIFDKRALTNDQDLITLVHRARAYIGGLDPASIKDSEALKQEVTKEMTELTALIDQAIIDKPARKIDLED